MYKNTKPTWIANEITGADSLRAIRLYKNEPFVQVARQDSLVLSCDKGLIDSNWQRDVSGGNHETIIWDEKTRLLFYSFGHYTN